VVQIRPWAPLLLP